jgi:hypothetical protein
MFHRIIVEQWQHALTVASFTIFFTAFLLILIRLWRTPHRKLEHLENLPLESDTNE